MLSIQELCARVASDPLTLAIAISALLGAQYLLSRAKSTTAFTKDGKCITPRAVPRLPRTLPVLGDALEIIPNHYRYHEWMLDGCKRFDFQPWKMKMPGQAPLFIFSSPEHFDQILNTQFDSFPKGEYQLEMVTTFFGKSLVGSDGERWYHQRKTAAKFFSARSLRAYMATSAKRNVELVMAILELSHEQKKPVNLTHLMLDFTMQTFAETGLGVELDWIGREVPHPFSVALDEAAELVSKRFVSPTWKLQRALNIGHEATLAKNMAYVVSWISETLQQSLENCKTKQSTSANGEEIKSMVDLFVEHSREDAEGIRSVDIVDFIQVMIIAARDTTAIALTWFYYELTRHPDVEARICSELETVYPGRAGKKDNYFTPDDARALVYLEAAMKEVMRLHPPAPFLFKEAKEDTVIDDDIVVRKGELAGISIYAAARNPHAWGEDASEFKPERWIDEKTGEIRQFASSKFSTFSHGPRSCVGMSLAMMELRAMAANLLSRYRFELASPVDGTALTSPLLPLKDHVIVNIFPASTASASATAA